MFGCSLWPYCPACRHHPGAGSRCPHPVCHPGYQQLHDRVRHNRAAASISWHLAGRRSPPRRGRLCTSTSPSHCGHRVVRATISRAPPPSPGRSSSSSRLVPASPARSAERQGNVCGPSPPPAEDPCARPQGHGEVINTEPWPVPSTPILCARRPHTCAGRDRGARSAAPSPVWTPTSCRPSHPQDPRPQRRRHRPRQWPGDLHC